MIYSNTLYLKLQEAGIQEYADKLNEYINNTFLTPNELNLNHLTISGILDQESTLVEIRKTLTPDMISNDLDDMFLKLFYSSSEQLRLKLILVSKTKFLSFITYSFLLGLITELDLKNRILS